MLIFVIMRGKHSVGENMKKVQITICVLVCILAGVVSPSTTSGKETRIALVIGNSAYNYSPLQNPVNDANDIAAALKKCNFRVMKVINANRKTMLKKIRSFGYNLRKYDVGLFYYAGHGIQVSGENYLVPIGAKVNTEDEVIDEGVLVSSVFRKMINAENRLNIIILDACRDNPFKSNFRSTSRGLARMDAPTGSILAYATAPGSVALDGKDRNGLYTSKLLKYIMTPATEIGQLFKQVRIEVMNESKNKQVPWESSSLVSDFFFIPNRGIAVKKSTKKLHEPNLTNYHKSNKASSSKKKKTRTRFKIYQNGIIRDHKTGLDWYPLDYDGISYTYLKGILLSNLNRGTGWRMPTFSEIRGLYFDPYDYRNRRFGRDNGGFQEYQIPLPLKNVGRRIWIQQPDKHYIADSKAQVFFIREGVIRTEHPNVNNVKAVLVRHFQ